MIIFGGGGMEIHFSPTPFICIWKDGLTPEPVFFCFEDSGVGTARWRASLPNICEAPRHCKLEMATNLRFRGYASASRWFGVLTRLGQSDGHGKPFAGTWEQPPPLAALPLRHFPHPWEICATLMKIFPYGTRPWRNEHFLLPARLDISRIFWKNSRVLFKCSGGQLGISTLEFTPNARQSRRFRLKTFCG